MGRGGVEPPTFRFSGGRSYRLSYLPSSRVVRDECSGSTTTEVIESSTLPGVPPRAEPTGDHNRAAGAGQALGIWTGSRLALFLFVALTAYLVGIDAEGRARAPGTWLLERFAWWDSLHFLRIAELGYLPPGLPCCDQVFFPGYPLAIRAVSPLVGGNSTVAGLAVAQVAGAVATVLLWRLAAESAGGARAGTSAALYLALAPYGIFLSAVYSESLFLALSLGAWWLGTRRRWWLAGVLAGAAAAVRINGLFLAVALIVMYALQARADRGRVPRVDAVALLTPFAVTAAYFAWLRGATGSWDAWREAQTLGWQRESAWPWDGLVAGWTALLDAPAPDLVVSRSADLLTAVGGVLLLGALIALRRWPEATYVGLNVAVLVCSTTLVSAPRYALLWFPGYLLAAQLTERPGWRWLRVALVVVCAPQLAALSLSFAAHQWVA